ncbi:MAG: hypothetical protein WCI73_11785 [Phycisphaerae bacterium]
MSQPPDDYDLKPKEPASPPPEGALPPGFVPPEPIIEGPDELEEEETAEQIDAREHRSLAMVGYVVFPLPLLLAPKSRFARFHGQQGLLIFLAGVALFVASSFISLVSYYGPTIEALALPLGIMRYLIGLVEFAWFLGLVYLIVQGILHAADGNMEPLPVIGKIQLLHPDPPSSPNPPPSGGGS